MPVPPPRPLGAINELGWGPRKARPPLQQLAPCTPCPGADGPVGPGGEPEVQDAKGPWGRCFSAHREVSWIWEVGEGEHWVRVWLRAII